MSEKSAVVRVPRTTIPVIHDVTAFRTLIEREKNRSNRSRLSFTLVAFKVSNGPHGTDDSDSFFHLIADEIRSADIVGWAKQDWLGVLLPATRRGLGEQFARRIAQKDPHGAQRRFIINSYPEQGDLGNEETSSAAHVQGTETSRRSGLFLWIVALALSGGAPS